MQREETGGQGQRGGVTTNGLGFLSEAVRTLCNETAVTVAEPGECSKNH